MEKVRRYRRNLAWVLVLATVFGMVQYPVHNTPVSVKAADSQTEKKVTLSEDGVLKVEGVYSVSAEMLDGIEKQEILKIEFDENVYFIKDHTFEGCHNLTEITWGGVTKIGSYAFADCENLDMMSLTQKVDTIQEGAFWGCSNIKLVIMPNDLKKLEKDAFPLATSFVWRYSKNEDEVEDEAIDDAFWTGRTGTMYVPDTDKWNRIIQQLDEKKITWTKRIAVSAYNIVYCQVAAEDSSISEEYWTDFDSNVVRRFTVEGTVTIAKIGEDTQEKGACIPDGICKASVKKLIIKNNIILNGTCNEYINLSSVEIENERSTISKQCFKELKKLQTVRLAGKAAFKEECFYGCEALENLYVGSCRTIETNAFYGCSSLKKLEISGGVNFIEESAFEGCTGLTKVNIGKKVFEIGKRAFYGCEKLESVELPVYTSKIQQDAFGNCPLLQTIVLPEQLSYVGLGNFTTCNIYWKGNEVTTQDPEEGEPSFFEQVTGTMYVPSGSGLWQKQKETYPEVAWEEWKPVTMQPETETYDLMEQWDAKATRDGVPVESCVDDEGVPCIKIDFSQINQLVAFRLPKAIRPQDYATVTIKARVGVQLMFDLWPSDPIEADSYKYGKTAVDRTYPFYYAADEKTTKYRTEDVGIYNDYIDYDLMGRYMSIGTYKSPAEAEFYGRTSEFYIYSITFNPFSPDTKKLVFESKMPDTPETETPSATYNPWEPTYNPWEQPTYNPWEPTQLPSASSAPTTTLKPTELPSVSQTPSAIPQPTETPTASQTPSDTPKPVEPPSASASVEASVVPSKKQSKRPSIWIQKKGNRKLRYVQITVKSSVGRYFDLYMKRRGKKFVRIRLAKNSLKKGKRVVKLVYVQKGYTLWFKVRTYDKINGKKKYRAYSGQKKIRL